MTIALAAQSVVRPDMMDLTSIAEPQWMPLAGAALVVLVSGTLPLSTGRIFLACAFAVGSVCSWIRQVGWPDPLAAIPVHLLLACTLILGAIRNDTFARILQRIGAVWLAVLFACAVAVSWRQPMRFDPHWMTAYLVNLFVMTIVCWQYVGNRLYVCAAAAQFTVAFAVGVNEAPTYARQLAAPRGLITVMAGLAIFAIAVLISANKGRTALTNLSIRIRSDSLR